MQRTAFTGNLFRGGAAAYAKIWFLLRLHNDNVATSGYAPFCRILKNSKRPSAYAVASTFRGTWIVFENLPFYNLL